MPGLWAFPGRETCLLIEGLLGDTEGVDRRGHPAVEDHLRDNFRDFLLGHADVESAGDVPLDHLRAVAQHDQSGDGAEAAGLEVHGGPVVYLAVDDCIHQPHYVRSQLRHGRRWLRVVFRAVVTHPEIRGGLLEVDRVHGVNLVHHAAARSVVTVVGLVLHFRLVGAKI